MAAGPCYRPSLFVALLNAVRQCNGTCATCPTSETIVCKLLRFYTSVPNVVHAAGKAHIIGPY